MKQQKLDMVKQTKKKDDDHVIDSELKNIIEAALYAAKGPLGVKKIMALFPDDAQPSKVDIQNVILNLEEECEFRGVELRRIGNGWRFQSKEKYSPWLRKLSGNKAPRYSRALLETLSIIAYRQPVTRSDIEEIRGVGVSSDTIRTLEERGWIAQIGHRDVPGRPALFGTTQGFLEYFNMASLRELPELMDKRQLGEIAKDLNLTFPMDGLTESTEDNKLESNSDDLNTAEDSANSEDSGASAEVIELHPDNQETTTQESDAPQLEESDSENAVKDLDEQETNLPDQSVNQPSEESPKKPDE